MALAVMVLTTYINMVFFRTTTIAGEIAIVTKYEHYFEGH